NNMHQLGIAFHAYHNDQKVLPHDITSKDGKPLLSWRVAILPYIEQNALYQQFHLDEPWDSEHNKKLADIAVPTFMHPAIKPQAPYTTVYQVFKGKEAVFAPGRHVHFQDITDGLSNTIMIAEAADGVPWTKPADLAYDAEKPIPKLGV